MGSAIGRSLAETGSTAVLPKRESLTRQTKARDVADPKAR